MKAVVQWVLKTMMKDQTGVMRTLPKKDLVDFNVAMTAERLARGGIDPNALKNANQVENAINQIESAEKANLAENIRGGIGNTKTAKVFDMEGKKIDPSKGIMGGKQLTDSPLGDLKSIVDDSKPINEQTLKEGLMKTDNPFSDLVKTTEKGPKTLKQREAEVLARMNRENKEAAQRIRNRKMVEEAIDNASPGFAGDRKYDAQLVADDLAEKRFGKDFYDLDQRQQMDLYDEALEGLANQKRDIPDPDDFAQGGRAGFSKGSGLKTLFDFLNKKSPMKAYTDYLESIKTRMKAGKEAEVAGEVIPIAAGGALITNQLKKKLKAMNEEQKKKIEKEAQEELRKDMKKANGGRIGLKDGMSRRSFLKILGGLATIPIVGKFLKPIKTAKGIKSVPIIKTDNVAGKPEWFDALVNKVIIEGDDVTKKFATAERQSIHQKTLDDGSVVRVTEDVDDGAVRVEYDSDANVFEDTVQMEYKKPLPDEGAPDPAAEFSTAESGPVGRAQGPDDFDIDVDEVGGSSISDLDSDVSKLKEYATGKKPSMKELVKNIERRKRARQITEDPEAQSDAIIRRQGDYDPSDYDDFASGGIARMLGE
jgi:hypothetical protein